MRIALQTSRRRSAMTLIELLVVISIIAVLVALTAGVIFRVVGGQTQKRTEATVKKVQVGFDAQWKAAIDDAKEDIKNGRVNLPAFASMGVSDRDAANALYVKMKLKIEFPQSFAEARNPGLSGFSMQAKSNYTTEIGATASGTAEQESAVLLFLALSQSRRGTKFNPDEIGGAVKVINVGGKDFKVIVDGWGTPITFQRFNSDAGLTAELTTLTGGKDPLDPYGKLNALPGGTKTAFQNLLNDQFTGQNRGPVLRSAGPDKNYNNSDDIIGFRLMKEGQVGN